MQDKYYQFTILKKYPQIIQVYTKKPINVNLNQVTKKKRNTIYQTIAKDQNYQFKKIKSSYQTHSSNVVIINQENLDTEIIDCDALITNLKGVALTMTTADCQSIFLYDPINEVIANIHSGWKGTLNTIVLNTINLMQDKFNSNPQDIIACISPSIGKCCFEVDEDVYLLFKEKFPFIDDFTENKKINNSLIKYYIDTKELNKYLLIKAGLKEDNIEISTICTKCEYNTYHSYRASKNESGRNLSLIALKE